MSPISVVMRDPFLKQSAKMLFTAWNHRIEALPPNRADQPFAMSVPLRHPDRGLEHRQTEGADRTIDALGMARTQSCGVARGWRVFNSRGKKVTVPVMFRTTHPRSIIPDLIDLY